MNSNQPMYPQSHQFFQGTLRVAKDPKVKPFHVDSKTGKIGNIGRLICVFAVRIRVFVGFAQPQLKCVCLTAIENQINTYFVKKSMFIFFYLFIFHIHTVHFKSIFNKFSFFTHTKIVILKINDVFICTFVFVMNITPKLHSTLVGLF